MAAKIIAALALCLCAAAFGATDEYTRVEIKGTLHNDANQRKATITSNGATYELDLGGSRDLRRMAEQFDRQQVVVNGRLFIENNRQSGGSSFVVETNRINGAQNSDNVQYDRRDAAQTAPPPPPERVVHEREVIREKSPLFKAGPLEIK